MTSGTHRLTTGRLLRYAREEPAAGDSATHGREVTMGKIRADYARICQKVQAISAGRTRVTGEGAGAQSGIKSLARALNVRCGMVTTQCVALSGEWLAGATSWGG